MRTFKEIHAIAAKRKGGPAALERLLGEHNRWAEESGRDLTAISRTLAPSIGT